VGRKNRRPQKVGPLQSLKNEYSFLSFAVARLFAGACNAILCSPVFNVSIGFVAFVIQMPIFA
jgi:hypothetical protein